MEEVIIEEIRRLVSYIVKRHKYLEDTDDESVIENFANKFMDIIHERTRPQL